MERYQHELNTNGLDECRKAQRGPPKKPIPQIFSWLK